MDGLHKQCHKNTSISFALRHLNPVSNILSLWECAAMVLIKAEIFQLAGMPLPLFMSAFTQVNKP